MEYFDSHCHLNDDILYPRVANVVNDAEEAGLSAMIVIGYDLPSSKRAVEIANRYPSVYAAVGFQPQNLEEVSDEALEEIRQLAKDPRVVAIGEIGLDYHWYKDEKDHEKQKVWFIKQIALANELGLPISIHARDAIQDTYDILKANPCEKTGVLHCYSGSVEMLREFAKLGYYFGFDGPVTYKNAKVPKECVKECPLDRILCETDSPYLPPTPHRGETNEPKYIPLIVKAMAEIKGLTEMEMAENLLANFKRLFPVKL